MSLSPEEIAYYKKHASDDLGPSIIASNAVGLFLAYISVAARVYARRVSKARFGWDDWLIIAALIPLSTYAIVGWIQIKFGEGRHVIFVTNRAGFIQGYVASIVAYSICVVLTKLSLLCLYCRIFSVFRNLHYISWAFGVFIVAYNLALLVVAVIQCIPLSSMWTGKPGKCIETRPPYTALGIVNVVADVAILALPIRYIFTLQLNTVRRIQISGIFLLGSVVCVFGIVRVVALGQAKEGDPSYNQVWSGVWSFCEIAVGVVAACLPTLAVLATKAHFAKIQASAIHLLSLTFRRSNHSGSNASSGSNGTGRQSTRSAGHVSNNYEQLSEVSLAQGKEGSGPIPPVPVHRGMQRFTPS